MKLIKIFSDFERFEMNWQRLFVQGAIILLTGGVLALASLVQPDAVVMSARFFSWLPLCGMVILSLGLLECLDAFFAKEQREFFQNLQVGVLDAVIGALIIFSVTETPIRISMMIAAFLIVRGIVRITLVYALHLPQTLITLVLGVISIIMGFMLWQQWPVAAGWFIAFCLSIEISFRGWAMMMFSLWVRNHQDQE
ncbi:MAG: hypothetical protein GQ569_10585 [Methylococcaceae bacterium]|nr:hypothetical protein [Methylococcaceae bacterium]